MITTVAVSGYRSLREVIVPLKQLTLVTGANGSGKSSLYRSLRLLADCGSGRVIGSLAHEGGLQSVLWGGPDRPAGARRRGHPTQGTVRRGPVSLLLGYATDDGFGYLIDLGVPPAVGEGAFALDPAVKREVVWSGPLARPAAVLVERAGPLVRARDDDGWMELTTGLTTGESMLTELADPTRAPELLAVREQIRAWRFYDGFRADPDAPARQAQVGTRTPVLAPDGADVAAALQTILETGDAAALEDTVADAFDGASLGVTVSDGRFDLALRQPGMLRPLRAAELSDGTLRYLLLAAALLTPRPPALMVLNEPETSLHPDLLPALARLVRRAAESTQLVLVSHSATLLHELDGAHAVHLDKEMGETSVRGQALMTTPAWHWGSR